MMLRLPVCYYILYKKELLSSSLDYIIYIQEQIKITESEDFIQTNGKCQLEIQPLPILYINRVGTCIDYKAEI